MIGSHSQTKEHLLLEVQETHQTKGCSIQERQGRQEGAGQQKVCCQTEGFRWSDQAHPEEEGQADQKDYSQT